MSCCVLHDQLMQHHGLHPVRGKPRPSLPQSKQGSFTLAMLDVAYAPAPPPPAPPPAPPVDAGGALVTVAISWKPGSARSTCTPGVAAHKYTHAAW